MLIAVVFSVSIIPAGFLGKCGKRMIVAARSAHRAYFDASFFAHFMM
jgi:hypothetical protein